MSTAPDIRPPGPMPNSNELVEEAAAKAVLAFLPIHKRALGVACGLVVGALFAGATLFAILVLDGDASGLRLLSEYFYGYTVSWAGVPIAFCWGFLTAFVFGWFGAFVHNFVVATYIFIARTRDELSQTRDFLDHI